MTCLSRDNAKDSGDGIKRTGKRREDKEGDEVDGDDEEKRVKKQVKSRWKQGVKNDQEM